jgi:hypothetical protein
MKDVEVKGEASTKAFKREHPAFQNMKFHSGCKVKFTLARFGLKGTDHYEVMGGGRLLRIVIRLRGLKFTIGAKKF